MTLWASRRPAVYKQPVPVWVTPVTGVLLRASAHAYWHDSQLGSSILQNFTSGSGGCILGAEALMPAPAAAAPATPPEVGTAFNSPPWPVDFSADVAASVRR